MSRTDSGLQKAMQLWQVMGTLGVGTSWRNWVTDGNRDPPIPGEPQAPPSQATNSSELCAFLPCPLKAWGQLHSPSLKLVLGRYLFRALREVTITILRTESERNLFGLCSVRMGVTISCCDLRMRHCEDFRLWSTRHWLELCFVLILLQSCWLAGKQLDFHLGYYWTIDHLFDLNILSLSLCLFFLDVMWFWFCIYLSI